MSKNIKSPCIRGLKRYEKSGCPQCSWNETRQEGCPAWSVLTYPDPDDPVKKKTEGNCLDIWQLKFQYSSLGLLEGNQKAVESFRNGMVEKVGNEVVPKIDRGIKQMLNMIRNQQSYLEY